MTDNAARQRQAVGYEPRFDVDLQYGQQGELVVTDIIQRLRDGSVETKRDGRWSHTGNLYVEYECLRGGTWQPSGIAATTAELWGFVLGDTEVAVFIPTETLKDMSRDFWKRGTGYRAEVTRGSHPTRGVKIPVLRFFDWLATRERRKVA